MLASLKASRNLFTQAKSAVNQQTDEYVFLKSSLKFAKRIFLTALKAVAKLATATGHTMQIFNDSHYSNL
jgi:hypothetical protein